MLAQGVQVDKMDCDVTAEEFKSPLGVESEEFCGLLRQQKYLNKLTERALKKNQPLIISNLMREKAYMSTAEDLVGIPKLEQMFLQALSMRVFPGSSLIEISLGSLESIDQEVSTPTVKDSATPNPTANFMSDSDMRTLVSHENSIIVNIFELFRLGLFLIILPCFLQCQVSTIQSTPQSIHKLAECLQAKLPGFSKSQLRNKVREVSDFADSRWQV